jgi:putative transposase
MGGVHLIRVLDGICAQRGGAAVISSDNRPELTAKRCWPGAHRNGIALRLIEPGKLNQNAYVESSMAVCVTNA